MERRTVARARREASVRGRDEARREEGRVQVERASNVRTEHVKRRSTVESQSQSQNVIRDARRHRASVRHRSVDQGEQAARAIGGLGWCQPASQTTCQKKTAK